MTALQSPSLQPHPALDWPIEATEFALIGDQLHNELASQKATEDVGNPDHELHFGSYLWGLTQDERPMFSLLGTTWPGKLYAYSPWAEDRVSERIDREFREVYADAGFFMDPRNNDPTTPAGQEPEWHPPVPRPCVGDPRMDPTVLKEGCMLPWLSPPFLFEMEEPADSVPPLPQIDMSWFTENDIQQTAAVMGKTVDEVRADLQKVVKFIRAETPDNEPQEYDAYIDYVTGRSPGLDGVTYVDGSRNEETND